MQHFALILFALLLSSHSSAETWKVMSACSDSKPQMALKLTGEIRPPLAEKLKELVDSCQEITELELRLDSPGGSFYETVLIADYLTSLKKKNIQIVTRVDNGDECDSMCTPLFAQGQKRQAGPVAAFMFHGVAVYAVSNIPNEKSTEKLIELLRSAPELRPEWLQSLRDQGVFNKPTMYWISGQELFDQKTGLVTELLDRQQFRKPYDRSYIGL